MAAGFTVTATTVAVQLGEDRCDLIGEVDRNIVRQSYDFDGQLGDDARTGRFHNRLAIFQRGHMPRGIDLNNISRFGRVLNFSGVVPKLSAGVNAGGKQLLPSVTSAEQNSLPVDIRFQTQLHELPWIAESFRRGCQRRTGQRGDEGNQCQGTLKPAAKRQRLQFHEVSPRKRCGLHLRRSLKHRLTRPKTKV